MTNLVLRHQSRVYCDSGPAFETDRRNQSNRIPVRTRPVSTLQRIPRRLEHQRGTRQSS